MTSRLLEYGAQVAALVKEDIKSPIFNAAKLKALIKIDIKNYKLVEDVFRQFRIDTCFHLAAQPIVGEANRSPIPTFESNIEGTWNILEAARKAKISGLIVASADKAYGEHKKLPYREDSALRALRPYDASKACADILSRTYAHTFNLPVAVARCSNVYGGGDINFSRIIPDTIRAVLNNRHPVIKSNGKVFRDYIFINDVIEAYLALAEAVGRKEIRGEAFNFGLGKPVSVSEVVEKIIKISGRVKLMPVILGQVNLGGEIDKQFLSIKKAKRLLRWQPRYGLEQGLKLTIDWYRDFFKK